MAADPRPGGTVPLDPGDPDDARIIARQVKAARQAGREGRDRARSTRGRADLEAAFDEGAQEGQQDPEPAEDPAPAAGAKPGRPGRPAAKGGTKKRPGSGRGASWRPTLTPPSRARDAGGLLTGMALYMVAITYIRYGPAGWKGWLAAKFLNKPMQGLPPSSLGTGGPKPPRTAAQEAT